MQASCNGVPLHSGAGDVCHTNAFLTNQPAGKRQLLFLSSSQEAPFEVELAA